MVRVGAGSCRRRKMFVERRPMEPMTAAIWESAADWLLISCDFVAGRVHRRRRPVTARVDGMAAEVEDAERDALPSRASCDRNVDRHLGELVGIGPGLEMSTCTLT